VKTQQEKLGLLSK